ncbi:MAG TPA: DNA-directed RNA polymerase subunit alpha, partial [Actinomycetota bacterium]|nr:DNA-directed RNA polymerase subunit alpha [Actinomycetota bacterium]
MLIVHRPQIVEEPQTDTRWKFAIEPLEPGFGYTLGNSLRRTLLSSIPGAAVTQIRIEGVLHEFSTINGVKEDVTDIILNVKDLVLRSEHDDPVSVFLRVQGPKDVTAADIEAPSGIEILNPDLRIATINKKARLDMELIVERGRGYVTGERNKRGTDTIGVIPIDSIFSPV